VLSQLQQEFFEQSQVGSVPRRIPVIIPVAQPTPELTEIASTEQFFAQAPHSIQASKSAIRAFLFSIVKTSWGQTRVHSPQPIHLSQSSWSVATFFKYLNFAIILSSLVMQRILLSATALQRLSMLLTERAERFSFPF